MIEKQITIGERTVKVIAEKQVRPDHRVVMKVSATSRELSHCEMWTLPHDNPNYSQEQAQKDFDTHCEKVARGLLGKRTAHDVTDNLC